MRGADGLRSHQSLHDARLERGNVHGHQISHLHPQRVLHHRCPYTGRATTTLTQGVQVGQWHVCGDVPIANPALLESL